MDLNRARAAVQICAAALLVLGLAFSSGSATAEPALPFIRLNAEVGSTDFGTIEAVGLGPRVLDPLRRTPPSTDAWKMLFAVYTGAEVPAAGARPAVAGDWVVDGDVLRFRPRYPLVPGLTYTARLDLTSLQQLAPGSENRARAIDASFSLPAPLTEPSTQVTQIYPTAAELPENLLRLYIQFSAPMSRGEAYANIQLLDAAGRDANHAFLDIEEELWDPGMRRFTLFLDPGRIKRGLRPHFEAGPPLQEGTAYRLVINPDWSDAEGQPLVTGFEKAFTVTAADREAPNPDDWRISPPAAGSHQALELRFPEPLDHGLLHRVVRVLDESGERIAGQVVVDEGETRFRLLPESDWKAGTYAIEVRTILEDLAGNNLKNVFDVDVNAGHKPATNQRTISLPFQVVSQSTAPARPASTPP